MSYRCLNENYPKIEEVIDCLDQNILCQMDVSMAESSMSADEMEAEMARIQRLREVLVRRESELHFMMDDIQLCKDIMKLKQELRKIVAVPDAEKTKKHRQREEKLLQEIHQLVQKRDFLVDDAEVERLRTEESPSDCNSVVSLFSLVLIFTLARSHSSTSSDWFPDNHSANKPSISKSSAALIKDCCGATQCVIM
uniref:BMERB domain-containing protein n=1 Tax=Sinocyclocheilus rhinocerous TaxID=307959 RepID=A0A673MIG3_9TELE